MRNLFLLLVTVLSIGMLSSASRFSEHSHTPADQDTLAAVSLRLDSLLFSVAFNTCDTLLAVELIHPDFEFYHDLGGVDKSYDHMVALFHNTCNGNYRKLVDGSLRQYPMMDQGKLYGMVQEGEHGFHHRENGKPGKLEMVAKFTHLWLLDSGKWKLARVLSFDHQPVE